MPDRIIREKALLSVTLDALTAEAERLFWRLVVVADDHGRFDADPPVVLARAFPRRVGTMHPRLVRLWLEELWCAGLLELYRVGERTYARFVTWAVHQRRRDSKPKFPGPKDGTLLDAPPLAATRGESRRTAARARTFESREPRAERSEPGAVGLEHPAANRGNLSRGVPPDGGDGGTHAEGSSSSNGAGPPVGAPPAYRIPASVVAALDRAPVLGRVRHLREPRWWQAELRANVGVDAGAEVLKAEAYLATHPDRARNDRGRQQFFHNWLKRAERVEA